MSVTEAIACVQTRHQTFSRKMVQESEGGGDTKESEPSVHCSINLIYILTSLSTDIPYIYVFKAILNNAQDLEQDQTPPSYWPLGSIPAEISHIWTGYLTRRWLFHPPQLMVQTICKQCYWLFVGPFSSKPWAFLSDCRMIEK